MVEAEDDPVSPDPQLVWNREERLWHLHDNDGRLVQKIARDGTIVERLYDLSGRPIDKALRRFRGAHEDWDGQPKALDITEASIGDRAAVVLTFPRGAKIEIVVKCDGVKPEVRYALDSATGINSTDVGRGLFPIEAGVTKGGARGLTVEPPGGGR